MLLAADLTVTLVAEGGQAIAQGVAVGDVVTSVGGRKFSSAAGNTDKDVKSALVAAKQAGKDLEITFNGSN
jgi:S1-C subfamily serine protease